jgi:mRNA interferase RelE/StbE
VRELQRLDPTVTRRILGIIERLAKTPRPSGCSKLTGSQDEWRIRVGDWRVLYTVDDPTQVVDIAAVRHRSDADR